jgi:hypothetical protein
VQKPILIGLIAALSAATPAVAQDTSQDEKDVYTVRNIAVDVTADSASAARKKAFDNAQRKAFKKLLKRIAGADALQDIRLPGAQQIGALVKNYGIDNEQVSKVRYKAAYRFTFQKEAVRNFFSDRGIAYSETRADPLLVLPFFQQGRRLNLWRGYNPWLGVWSESGVLEGLLPLEVPIGDLHDVRNINGDNALTYNPQDLEKMLKRYEAKEAVLLIAAFNEGPPPRSMDAPAYTPLTIYVYRTDNKAPQFVRSLHLRPDSASTLRDLLKRGVEEVAGFLRKDWKQQTAVRPGQRETIEAVVRFDGLEEWLDMRTRLRGIGGVDSLDIKALSADRARLVLGYRGTLQQFGRSLRRDGLQANSFYPGQRGRYGSGAHNPVMNIHESTGARSRQTRRPRRIPRNSGISRRDRYQQRNQYRSRPSRPDGGVDSYNRRNPTSRNRKTGNSRNSRNKRFESYPQNQQGY